MDQVSECFYRKYAIKIRQKKNTLKKSFYCNNYLFCVYTDFHIYKIIIIIRLINSTTESLV